MTYAEEKNEILKYELSNNIRLLEKALENFKPNYKHAFEIGIKENYSYDELYIMDSLTSRFARISDIFTQKVLRSYFEYAGESPLSFIDRANFAEKLGIIISATELISVRRLRNDIVHDYTASGYGKIIHEVMRISGDFIKTIETACDFIKQKVF